MRARAILGCAVLATVAATPQAFGADGVPLRQRDGGVVSWQPRSNTAVVALPGGNVIVIHSLRKYTPGTAVRVQGVKWGSAVDGVKWGLQPAGVKWGIAVARNGTFKSPLTTRGRATTMALRVTVIRRTKKSLVVSAPGATFVLPFAKRAVWLPGPKLVHAKGLEQFGTQVSLTVRTRANGVVEIVKVREVDAPAVGSVVPVAGRVLHRDLTNRTLRVQAGGTGGVTVLMTVPANIDLRNYPVGAEVSGTVVPGALGEVVNLLVTGISRNDSWALADSLLLTVGAAVPPGRTAGQTGLDNGTIQPDPEAPPVATPPATPPTITPTGDPVTDAQLAQIVAIQTSWTNARTSEPPSVISASVYSTGLRLLQDVQTQIAAGRKAIAVLELVGFELVIGKQPETAITAAYKAQVIGLTTTLRIDLLSHL